VSPFLDDPQVLRKLRRWRKAIVTSWQRHVPASTVTGRLLIRSHDDLISHHGAWLSMVRNDLPFDYSTAKKLISIAENPVLSDDSYRNRLPVAWTTLYQLSLIDPPTLKRLIEQGEVNASTEREDVERLRRTILAGTQLATIVEPPVVARSLATLQAAITKFIERMYARIEASAMTDYELRLILTKLAAMMDQMKEFGVAIERRTIEPMRTINEPINEPMWNDDE
jgi:hypothetical protein